MLTKQDLLEHMATESRYVDIFHDPFNLGGRRSGGVRPGDYDLCNVEQDTLFPDLWLSPFPDSVTQVRVMRRTCALFEAAADPIQYGKDFMAFPVYDTARKKKGAELN